MDKRKIKETPALASGLLSAADRIGTTLSPVEGDPHRTVDLENFVGVHPRMLRKFGRYQSRVILTAMAAELVLKFLYEQRGDRKPAPQHHDLHKLYGGLTGSDQHAVEFIYQRLLRERDYPPSEDWCERAYSVFEQCKNAFVDWRYIGEGKGVPYSFEMRATYLSLAVRSVLEVVDLLPILPASPKPMPGRTQAADHPSLSDGLETA